MHRRNNYIVHLDRRDLWCSVSSLCMGMTSLKVGIAQDLGKCGMFTKLWTSDSTVVSHPWSLEPQNNSQKLERRKKQQWQLADPGVFMDRVSVSSAGLMWQMTEDQRGWSTCIWCQVINWKIILNKIPALSPSLMPLYLYIWFHHFMADRWGNSGNSGWLYFSGL